MHLFPLASVARMSCLLLVRRRKLLPPCASQMPPCHRLRWHLVISKLWQHCIAVSWFVTISLLLARSFSFSLSLSLCLSHSLSKLPIFPSTGSVDHEETARAEAGQSGGTLKSKSVQLWSAHDVSRYVQSLQRDFGEKASMYADTMVREDISGSVLLKLEDKDLKELGFSLGHRKVMLLHISSASKNLFF